jgi:hypothetical protein
MDVFSAYKPFKNKIGLLSIEDSLAVIWAYCQYLQIDNFYFPSEIEVASEYLNLDTPQIWIAEWTLELLAKEIIINGNAVASKGRTLRTWKTMSEVINHLKDLENKIAGQYGSPQNVLVELIRVAHRQFIWQANAPNSASTIRYYKIFNRPAIDAICESKIGLNIWQLYMCGVAVMGAFLERPALTVPFKSDIKALSIEHFEKFFAFTSKSISALKATLKSEQQYDENFAYTYNSLRAIPLVRMAYRGDDALVCPLLTLLYWRFTGGLYYELIAVPEFANEFGEGFQAYVGEVVERACPTPMEHFAECEYVAGKSKKRSVDWIVADATAALFLECKAKRLSWAAKESLTDLAALQRDIDSMAAAIVQTYKTLADYLDNLYPHFHAQPDLPIFPIIVTLENWRMFGPVMLATLDTAVGAKMTDAGISPDLVERMPYSIIAIEDLEVAVQIMRDNGIVGFMRGKLEDCAIRQWDWHGYMVDRYRGAFPVKKLFDKEYDEIFAPLFVAQSAPQ